MLLDGPRLSRSHAAAPRTPPRPGSLPGSRRSRSLREITERFGISKRTAYRDLASLESLYIPKLDAVSRATLETWGVYRGPKCRRIVLHFDASLGPLLESACHHPGEEIQQLVDGGIEYRVTLNHLDEIARWAVGFGGGCRVVEPEALREKVGELAEGALGRNLETL